ncbi:ribosome biogenesis GTPase YlqF [Helcococcus kunzii]|uniref:Ribosome biogenesis GTPase A n=1 Tax=Helcococcus kunzii ATCC 51366 TaxID=883114 RepID=H3NNF9_9FIRM|nr:ribosome biogenesis GTPase YlqF [Helcococcus kunzii]EHR33934.1 ribosome biogenesis GTP-binding protein YlqF [Helcococcus kunzii ATCC 51366]QUY64785.1 ribosome biogenesis GTPase YlqF [Helcococcus kunzii]
MNINWYPGHMKKSIDKIRESLKLVDIVAEIVDSRIPISSRNPVIDKILGDFPRIIILNKVDMANPKETRKWIKYFNEKNISVIEFNSTKDKKTNDLYKIARKTLEPLFAKRKEKQIKDETIKMMVVGIPNVGKSTFINNVSQRKGTKVGNRPGVTRMNQWIRTSSNLLLLDTPGVLWPKLDLPDGGKNLAFTGAIKDEILEIEDLCFELIKKLQSTYYEDLINRYGIENDLTTIEIMDSIALKFGAIKRNKEIDYFKVANIILDDFRKVRIGRITLETVEELK